MIGSGFTCTIYVIPTVMKTRNEMLQNFYKFKVGVIIKQNQIYLLPDLKPPVKYVNAVVNESSENFKNLGSYEESETLQ